MRMIGTCLIFSSSLGLPKRAGAMGPSACEQIGVLESDVHGAAAAHRMAHQVDAVIVDGEFLARQSEHVHHILLAQFGEVGRRVLVLGELGRNFDAVPAAGVKAHRRDDDVTVLLGETGEAGVIHDLLRRAAEAMQGDHERSFLLLVVVGRDEESVLHFAFLGFLEIVGAASARAAGLCPCPSCRLPGRRAER